MNSHSHPLSRIGGVTIVFVAFCTSALSAVNAGVITYSFSGTIQPHFLTNDPLGLNGTQSISIWANIADNTIDEDGRIERFLVSNFGIQQLQSLEIVIGGDLATTSGFERIDIIDDPGLSRPYDEFLLTIGSLGLNGGSTGPIQFGALLDPSTYSFTVPLNPIPIINAPIQFGDNGNADYYIVMSGTITTSGILNPDPPVVPEPASLAIFGTICLLVLGRRKSQLSIQKLHLPSSPASN